MDSTALLSRLKDLGAAVSTDGNTLFVSPTEVLTVELRTAIRANKTALIETVQGRASLRVARDASDTMGQRIDATLISTLDAQELEEYRRAIAQIENGASIPVRRDQGARAP